MVNGYVIKTKATINEKQKYSVPKDVLFSSSCAPLTVSQLQCSFLISKEGWYDLVKRLIGEDANT